MVRKLLLYGMLVGLAAGLLAFVVAKTIGEPQVDKAIAFEGLVAQSHHEAEGAELVSRTVQNTAGLGAGVIVFGVAFGGIFALVFALAYGRLGTLTAPRHGRRARPDRLRRRLPGADPQVPGDAAGRRQPGHDRTTHGAVPLDDRDLRWPPRRSP